MLWELFQSNQITRHAQALTLRAYMVPEPSLTQVGFMHPGGADEAWTVSAVLVNHGSLPALNVVANGWIDERADNYEVPLPAGVEQGQVPPNGAAIVSSNTTKADVREKLARQGCFLHLNAYYQNGDKKRFKVVATFALSYLEGKSAIWIPVHLSGD
jgi:hypothetical protein